MLLAGQRRSPKFVFKINTKKRITQFDLDKETRFVVPIKLPLRNKQRTVQC